MSNTKTANMTTPSVPAGAEGIVELKPLPKKGWSGVNLYPKCHDTICVGATRNGYLVSLTEEERLWLEQELRLEPGALKTSPPIEGQVTFWDTYGVVYTGKPLKLDLSNPKHYLDYKVLISSGRVANSWKERSKFPKATYVFHDTETDRVEEGKRAKVRKEAYKRFLELSAQEMLDIMKIMGKPADKTKMDTVETYLENLVTSKPQDFLDMVSASNFKVIAFVKDLQNANVIRKIKGMWAFGDTSLGSTAEEVADFLLLKDNQEIYILLKQRFEAAQGPRK